MPVRGEEREREVGRQVDKTEIETQREGQK